MNADIFACMVGHLGLVAGFYDALGIGEVIEADAHKIGIFRVAPHRKIDAPRASQYANPHFSKVVLCFFEISVSLHFSPTLAALSFANSMI